ncbi:MAG TPA: hypothetical protein VH158_01935 [Gemmatimonadales bacterium]|nr:hypothetical protein [Gemmatimonadales bacterium]
MTDKRLYLAVAACALVVHLGALWNRYAVDDVYIVALNPVVQQPGTFWRAFLQPYWPGNLAGTLYRPLVVVTFALDRLVDGAAWFHAVNLLWHAGASVGVAALTRRWAGAAGAAVAGVLFAVHPAHVEAAATLVGRSDLMAAVFTLLAVYAAVERGSVGWSAAALGAGLLSKEGAVVIPALIVWAWAAGVAPLPSRRKLAWYAASWGSVAVVYAVLRWMALRGSAGLDLVAPVFADQGPVGVRLTAISAFADVVRLLLFPLHLSADYSPNERTAVRSVLDGRFLLGLLCLAGWGLLVTLAWRRRRRIEAFGLGWIGIAYLPVANLLFPIGVLIAERTLYLPSVGLAVAAGAACRDLPAKRVAAVAGILLALGGVRSALRVPAWRDNRSVSLRLLEDAPKSYHAWDYTGWALLWAGKTERALDAFLTAGRIYPWDARVHLAAADAAFSLGRNRLADSLLAQADRICRPCAGPYRGQAEAARQRGAQAAADSLLARARKLEAP